MCENLLLLVVSSLQHPDSLSGECIAGKRTTMWDSNLVFHYGQWIGVKIYIKKTSQEIEKPLHVGFWIINKRMRHGLWCPYTEIVIVHVSHHKDWIDWFIGRVASFDLCLNFRSHMRGVMIFPHIQRDVRKDHISSHILQAGDSRKYPCGLLGFSLCVFNKCCWCPACLCTDHHFPPRTTLAQGQRKMCPLHIYQICF